MRVRCSRSLWFYVELKYNSLNLDFYLVVVNYGPRSAVESILGKNILLRLWVVNYSY